MPKPRPFLDIDAGAGRWRHALLQLLNSSGVTGFQLARADRATLHSDHDAIAQLLGDAAEKATGSRDFARWIDLHPVGLVVTCLRRREGGAPVLIDDGFARAVEEFLVEALEAEG